MARTADRESGRELVSIIIFFLAVWRLTKMFTDDEGPGMVFTRIRELTGAERLGVLEPWETMTWYAKLNQCPYCLSVWTSLTLCVLLLVNRKMFDIVTMILAGSAVTVLIEDRNNG